MTDDRESATGDATNSASGDRIADQTASDRGSDGATDPRKTLGRALDQAGMVIARITPDQVKHATPCQSWDVGTVANHLINGVDRFRRTVAGEDVDWSTPMPDVEGEWAAEFHDRADALTAAWAAVPDMSATSSSAMGEISRSFTASQQITEIAQHTWDLAAATGQRNMLVPDIATEALVWARQSLKPEYRGTEGSGMAFGPEQPVADDAPAPDRLAAFFGRDPNFVGEDG